MNRILIVEDDHNSREGLKAWLDDDYSVTAVADAEKGIEELNEQYFDVVLTDIMLPGINGMEFARKIKANFPDIIIIVTTALDSVRDAVDAMRQGVYDYLTKPIKLEELLIVIKRGLEKQELREENIRLKDQIRSKYRFDNIIGNSNVMQEVFKKIDKVSTTNSTVLIRGESGTGKELIARAIHFNSPRANKPLVEISCTSLPDTLLESELFGHEKGAFTGAIQSKPGKFEVADRGTIFLDEIGDVNPEVQLKLLRVLQERTFTRLGSNKVIEVDVRVIAATNADLEERMKENKIRDDLYYRLNVIPIFIPPLRDRKEDITLLIDYFIKKNAKASGEKPKQLNTQALKVCMNYDWPGNVRELENAIENACVMSESKTIIPEDLPFYLLSNGRTHSPSEEESFILQGDDYTSKIEHAEKIIIQKSLKESNGNRTKAAKKLGISIRSMRYKVKKYNL